ncbi:MAG TPA: 2Fe-2S iron-sulfur cluster-binding protein [Xanthobacteraceae bacterium]
MVPIALTVNGRKVQALVEPRTHLADFLREHCRLTGTHLGCEHGVCGACTVLIGGAPARSCLTYAVACEGLAIDTIEGFDDDPLMAELREAFSREHGLQCGFCTPGMLIAARDIVQRLPNADEPRIRVELSGNLCRCTGYRGIVNAVRSVLAARRSEPAAPEAAPAAAITAPPLTAFAPKSDAIAAPVAPAAADESRQESTQQDSTQQDSTQQGWTQQDSTQQGRTQQGWTRFEESFVIGQPPAAVWQAFADVPAVAACLPGTTLAEYDAQSVKGTMSVKLGPIRASFAGSAVIERDDAARVGVIRGAGRDRGTGSRTRGEVSYRLVPDDDGRRTRVLLSVDYSLQGALAQFSRSGIARDLARRLVADFAANLNGRLAGAPPEPRPSAPLNVGRLLRLWLADRLRRWFARG